MNDQLTPTSPAAPAAEAPQAPAEAPPSPPAPTPTGNGAEAPSGALAAFEAAFDVAGHNEGRRLMVLSPAGVPVVDDEGEEVWILLAGCDSDAYKKADRDIQAKRMARAERTRRAGLTPEQLAEDAARKLAAVTLDWHPFFNVAAGVASFSKEVARRLYMGTPAIREQVDDFVHDRRVFMRR